MAPRRAARRSNDSKNSRKITTCSDSGKRVACRTTTSLATFKPTRDQPRPVVRRIFRARQRRDVLAELGQNFSRQGFLRPQRALTKKRPAPERTRGVNSATTACIEQWTWTLGSDHAQGADGTRVPAANRSPSRGQRVFHELPLYAPKVRLSPGSTEVTAIGGKITRPASDRSVDGRIDRPNWCEGGHR